MRYVISFLLVCVIGLLVGGIVHMIYPDAAIIVGSIAFGWVLGDLVLLWHKEWKEAR